MMVIDGLGAQGHLTRQCQQLQNVISRQRVALTELSYTGPDDLDRATDFAERDRILGLQHVVLRHLAQIQHALEWHNNDHKGLCEVCNGPIGPARLEVVPEATRCAPCQRNWEMTSRHRRRYW